MLMRIIIIMMKNNIIIIIIRVIFTKENGRQTCIIIIIFYHFIGFSIDWLVCKSNKIRSTMANFLRKIENQRTQKILGTERSTNKLKQHNSPN